MEFNVTREQWIERFAMHLATLQTGAEPGGFVDLANRLWQTRGEIAPEAAADAEFATRAKAPDAFEDTHQNVADDPHRFEKTERIPVERLQSSGDYVRDNDEWVARCVGRVLQLDPIIKADEARRSVTDLSELERWRLMRPEAAAEQLYTPIKPRAS